MQLNITELDDTLHNNKDYNQIQTEMEYEKIPDNNVPIKVIKKGVHFANSTLKPMHQSIPKTNAKINRPQMPPLKPKISYDDILSKMGMFVSDGKLHLMDRNTLHPQQQTEISSQIQYPNQYQPHPPNQYQPHPPNQYQPQSQSMDYSNIPKNSYIYNKYFKDEIQQNPSVRKPSSLHEYKMMLLDDYIQRKRIKQIKSTKLIMPTSNINVSAGNSENFTSLQNKLFSFSKR